MNDKAPPPIWERAAPWALFAALTALYHALRQPNLTYDGAAFLAYYADAGHTHPNHPLFGWFLHEFIAAGRLFGASPWAAGAFQSAFFTAAACAVFYRALRGAVAFLPALAFAALLGLNAATIENATTVELYGASLFAAALAFAAFSRAARDPSRISAAALFLACAATTALCVGYALWPLALYLALAWGDRKSSRRGMSWIAQGAGVALAIGAWLWIAGAFGKEEAVRRENFFEAFTQAGTAIDGWRRVFEEPFKDFALWAGPILFPAIFGAAAWGRERPAEARAMLLASYFFFVVYSFWPGDLGSFHLPLFPAWGFFAAIAIDRWDPRRRWWSLPGTIVALCLYAWAFTILPRAKGEQGVADSLPIVFAALFWAAAVAQLGLGLWFRGDPAAGPRRPARLAHLCFAVCAIALACAAYSPRALERLQPDKLTLYCDSFKSLAPPLARLVTIHPPFRPEIQAERETLSALAEWRSPGATARIRATLSDWMSDAARPVYLDADCYRQRSFIWGAEQAETFVQPPLDRIRFDPVFSQAELFFLATVLPPDAPSISPDLEPHDFENWDGVPVRWTRRAAEIEFEPKGPRLNVKYWVGHPDVSAENPVTVEMQVLTEGGAGPRVSATHTQQEGRTQELSLEGMNVARGRLRIEVSRSWNEPEGRELGVAVYPLE